VQSARACSCARRRTAFSFWDDVGDAKESPVLCKARALGLLVMAGCTVGAPPGFSGGDHWTFPLVGPLEDGLLVTPATVKGHGPYLFAIDPDANFSAIDEQVVGDAGLRTAGGPEIIDETNTGQVRVYAELLDLKVSALAIERRSVMLYPAGYYDSEGRHINGVLGRDVIDDALVFGFDRDQGIATLATAQTFTPPPDAIAIQYQDMHSEASGFTPGDSKIVARGGGTRGTVIGGGSVAGASAPPVPRRLVTAQVGQGTFAMHLDLGAAVSQLPKDSWSGARLKRVEVELRLVDEAGTARSVTQAGVAEVTLSMAKAEEVTFAPYVEARFGKQRLEGALGLDFFRGYAVYANWGKRTFYLKPRGDAAATTTARLARWGAALPPCPHPGCATVALVARAAGPTLEVTRDAAAADRALELLVGVTRTDKPPSRLLVELPRKVDKVNAQLPAEYAGATLAVLDASPFVRSCPGGAECVARADESLTRGRVLYWPPAAPASAPPP
jgi:hypothetical protein